ncbi:lantibiotic biosynthesis protein [Saccharothrix sp. 6-C]|uniref:lantibiotic dehydratase C-terminal domain-containing protein n=1 Tax=Saccharothrix sp. 6-C TaxID=2781735 RepID=UPI00191781D5|nr:lantibiotic dehydratase C-terminal domain-containing protein [Saccharothrix sp. 6-C]QQQ79270.1 lantibiotic biosynthesis protein [Saccharothrix sp. 6-C]
MAEPVRDWVGAHVFHRGDQDLLVTGAMAPVCEDLTRTGRARGWFFLRYWEGGPHVRLRVLAKAPAEVRSAVARSCARHLADHPSPPGGWSQGEYEAVARRRAEDEHLTGWDRRLREVDTVEFVAYEPDHRAYGDGRALRAVERHFTDSSRVAVHLLTAPPDRRAGAALAMLTLALAVCEPDLDRAAARFAAVRTRLPSPSRPDRRDDLREQTRRLWARASADPVDLARADVLATWWRSVRALHATLSGLRARGDFAPVHALSPFSGLARALRPDDPVVAHVVLRCAHLLCNRLGLPAATEARLGALTARTLSELPEHHDEVAPL